jgi:HAD superfamily hydrolase (TIGR01509 family)
MKSPPAAPKAILFDHDGVLVTSEQLHFLAWQQLIRDIGLPWEKISFHGLVGRTAPQILRIILDEFKPGWSEKDYNLDELAHRKNDYYLVYAQTQLAPYPGVREGLMWAREQGILCGVVSNARRRELNASLTLLNLEQFFQVIVSRDDVPKPKPDPGPFEYAALALGVLPQECIAIDDSPTGLEGALLAGCLTASVTTNYPRNILESPVLERPDLQPAWIGDTLDQFFDWVRTQTPRG